MRQILIEGGHDNLMLSYIITAAINKVKNLKLLDSTEQENLKVLIIDEGDAKLRKKNNEHLKDVPHEYFGPRERREWFKGRFGSAYRRYEGLIPERCHAETSFGFPVAYEENADVVLELDDDVFKKVDGFDDDYFIYDDDTDFCWRARLLGYSVVFVPSARVSHSGQIAKGVQPRKMFHGVKNRGYTLLKNYELGNLWWRMCVYYVAMSLCALIFVFLLKPGQALTSLRGLADMIINFKKIWRKRVKVQSRRLVSDKELFEQKLLRKDLWATLSYLRNVAPVAIARKNEGIV